MAAASRNRRKARNMIAENILTQGRPRGQLLRVIRQIEGQIDAPLKRRLRDGSIRLLKCSWLMDEQNLKQHLGVVEGHDSDGNEHGGASFVIKRRQDLPEEAFVEPDEAALLLSRGDRSILALSYGWLTRTHPDPHGTTLATLLRYMHEATPSVAGCALFWDFASLPQADETGYRTKEEQAMLRKALEVMSSSYGSIKGTAVLQIKDAHEAIPADGGISGAAYNTTPYEARGWCIMEAAASATVEAQLAVASRERRLPGDLRKAMDSRPKTTDISRRRAVRAKAHGTRPEDVLASAEAALSKSTFSGEGDQELVSELLSNYGATIQRAVLEPPSSAREFLAGPVDLALGSRDAQRPVFHPPSAPAGIYARPLKAGGEIYSRPGSAASRRSNGPGASAHGLLRPQSAGPSVPSVGNRAQMA
jgi:hypothetical protein